MDGLYVKSETGRWVRPTSKKAVKEAIAADPASVTVESTSLFGGVGGAVDTLPAGTTITFVGPDPYTSRKFYGTIKVGADGKVKVA